jgi:hypothetical protein
MAVKTTFEPKDPRITFEEEYNSDDQHDWTSDEQQPRKRKTGTQALVEFLNTTSPEEFQKDSPKRPSALFFRRRKPTNNNKPITVAPVPPIHRKNYIEIIANPFMFNKTKSSSSNATTPTTSISTSTSTSTTTTTTRTPTHAGTTAGSSTTVIGSQLVRTLSKSSTSIYTPPLPTRKSIYSNNNGSLQTSRSPSVLTNAGFVRRQPSLRVDISSTAKQTLPMNILPMMMNNVQVDDVIEEGLKHRLNQFKKLELDKPSDFISKIIAQEHTAALDMLFSLTNDSQQQRKKRRPRHIQVQTMPYVDQETTTTTQIVMDDEAKEDDELLDHQVTRQRLEKVEKELKQEKLINSRLEAALEETRDQYEMLTGLAYKKLREVWEEKSRWENACIETKERCWHDHQQQILGNLDDSQSILCPSLGMDFLLEEENEYEEEEEE